MTPLRGISPHEPGGPGLYIHVPFCVRRCGYCDFYSLARSDSAPDAARYLDALEAEARRLPGGFRASTIFIGGGTPTHLNPPHFDRLLRLARGAAGGSDSLEEWTIEANPGTLTAEKLDIARAHGVTRLSIGAQSFDPDHLRTLDRIHAPRDISEAVRAARAAGFAELSLDLMYGLPGQSLEGVRADVQSALALEPDHLALYALTIEDGTPLQRRIADSHAPPLPEDEAVREHYDAIRADLRDAGWEHYEISNFCRPGHPCRHNVLYWTGGEYAGLGPSAHSHWKGTRRSHVSDFDAWATAQLKGADALALEEHLSPERRARETLVCALRLIAGVDREGFRNRTGFDYEELCGRELDALEQQGLIVRSPGRIRLAESALFISDTVFAALV